MRTTLLLLLTACVASASPGGETMKSLLQEREQILVRIDDLMKERYKSGLCHWTETVSARLQLLEFRRDHAASLKEGIAFQKEIVALREEEYRVFQKSLEADPSLRGWKHTAPRRQGLPPNAAFWKWKAVCGERNSSRCIRGGNRRSETVKIPAAGSSVF